MSHSMRLLYILAAILAAMPAIAQQKTLLVISLDGMRPDYVLKADEHQLKIPHLRKLLHDGAHATGVRGVLPTVTYPSHTTLITGVWPAKHGIYSNVAFDPLGVNMDGWLWYADDIRVPTLWGAAAKAGLVTASVSWPVTVNESGIRYNIPEYWRAPKGPDDPKLRRAISSPGLMDEIGKTAGVYIGDLDDAENGDRSRTAYSVAILRQKHPQFMTIHLAALDHLEHAGGPFSPEANNVLEKLDGMVGEIEAAAPGAIVCVVSDHGFARVDHTLALGAAFAQAGLLKLDPKSKNATHVVDWKAIPHLDGGSAAILLKDPKDEATRGKVRQLLKQLAADPANGIARVLEKEEIARMGGNPDAAFWVDMKTNFAVAFGEGAPFASERKVGGTHGYAPTHPELLASFFIAGPGIPAGLNLGEIDMRSIAPTLAKLLGVSFPSADLRPLAFAGR